MHNYNVQPATKETIKRLQEVQFYLIIQQLQRAYGENTYTNGITENICQLCMCKLTNINLAAAEIKTLAYRPSALELVLTNKYLGINMRTLALIGRISNKTMYNALRNYDNTPLEPKLEEYLYEDVSKFVNGMKRIFEHMTYILGEPNVES